jgi:exosortase N
MLLIDVLNIRSPGSGLRFPRINVCFFICIVLSITGAVFAFPASYLSSTNVALGLVLVPVSLCWSSTKRFNATYLLAMLVFAAISFRYQVKIFYFFALAFYLLMLIELFVGKCDQIILFLILFMSPFFHQVIAIMGFPIRLGLSSLAGNILLTAGVNVKVEGNLMMLNGSAFSVDEACMGLNMLSTSLLMAVFAIAYQYRVQKNRLSFLKLFLFFAVVFFLNLFCNLLRIIILVALAIGPENPMHEIVGLLCFFCYIMVPILFLSSRLIRKSGTTATPLNHRNKLNPFLQSFLLISAIILLSLGVYLNNKKGMSLPSSGTLFAVPGYESVPLNDGITKLFNKETLVYIKPIPEFFSGEHTPLICWRGGGYSFKGIRKSIVNGQEVYIGKLARPGEVLFTAWWYSNGKTVTINQMDWRFRMMKGEEPFSLVNVTVSDEASLNRSITFFLNQRL